MGLKILFMKFERESLHLEKKLNKIFEINNIFLRISKYLI